MNFWTATEILGGLTALAGIIIAFFGLFKKTQVSNSRKKN